MLMTLPDCVLMTLPDCMLMTLPDCMLMTLIACRYTVTPLSGPTVGSGATGMSHAVFTVTLSGRGFDRLAAAGAPLVATDCH